jgi:hypothetical protein
MSLLKDISTVQNYINVNTTNKIDSILPYVKDAQEKYLKQYLGKTLLDALDAWYNDTTPETNAPFTALLPYVQNPLAKFSYYLAIPSLDVKVTDSGIGVVQNANLVPASEKRVSNLRESTLQMAYDNIETLLVFLEENKADYPTWVASEAYTVNAGLIINSASDFNKFVNIDNSRLTYMRLQQTINNVELLIIGPAISATMLADIKAEIAAGTVSAKYTAILDNIKRSIANYTIANADIDTSNLPNNNAVVSIEPNKLEKYKLLGETYLVAVRKVLDAAPTTYTLYAASDAYDSTLTDYSKYENTAESTNYVFGGG